MVAAAGDALLPLALLLAVDLFVGMICERLPLAAYLAAAALGLLLWLPRALRPVAAGDAPRQTNRAKVMIGLTLFFAALLTARLPFDIGLPGLPAWDSHCGWKYCGSVLRGGLMESPFPTGKPPCTVLLTCSEEYPFSASERSRWAALARENQCEEPYFPAR